MENERVAPILCHHLDDGVPPSTTLPSFPSLREKNLRTLYGGAEIGGFVGDDKSPKGSVDEKIRPLVDLINRHPEYVTLSSCSGRVALFDPGEGCEDVGEEGMDVNGSRSDQQKVKGTEISGKGRGRWIFVTHDILPDLGPQLIQALRAAGQDRCRHRRGTNAAKSTSKPQPITFKHEPPLLHVAAASLAAGRRLLRLAKSECAMRESGLVVTEARVTVEVRTTGTMLCVPLMVDGASTTRMMPREEYLMALAGMANERMGQSELLLGRLHGAVLEGLFAKGGENQPSDAQGKADIVTGEEQTRDNERQSTLAYEGQNEPYFAALVHLRAHRAALQASGVTGFALFEKMATIGIEYRLREERAHRCPNCWYDDGRCVCARMPPRLKRDDLHGSSLAARVKFLLLMHHKEYLNAGNSAKVLLQLLPESMVEQYVYGKEGDFDRFVDEVSKSDPNHVMTLWPGAKSQPLHDFVRSRGLDDANYGDATNPSLLRVIVLDGTYNNAKNLHKALQRRLGDRAPPNVALHPTTASKFHRATKQYGSKMAESLKVDGKLGDKAALRISTAEACGLCLVELGADMKVGERIEEAILLNNVERPSSKK